MTFFSFSRVDGRQRHGSSHSDSHRAKSCDSSHSGSSGRHLTGEMIRQLQEQRKGPLLPSQQQQQQPQQQTTTTTATNAVSQHHQHLLQMNAAAAAYERALKVRNIFLTYFHPISSFHLFSSPIHVLAVMDHGIGISLLYSGTLVE